MINTTKEVRSIMTMYDGRWLKPYAIQRMIYLNTGYICSESSITARIREMRNQGFDVQKRPVKNSNAFEYKAVRL